MANPLIPGISATEQDLLYKKLSIYNQKKASFKEAGAYLVVLPRTDYPRYSLWVRSPSKSAWVYSKLNSLLSTWVPSFL